MEREIFREFKIIYMESAKLILGCGLHPIAKSLISIMCILMCITSCGKTQSGPAHTEKPEWSYESENGPDIWAELSPEYILCAAGKHQSPIDLVNPTPAKLPPIIYEYHRTTSLNIRNTGHTIEVASPEGNWVEVDGTRYQLLQFHFHAPSEHTVASKSFDMEMHFVHKSEEGNLAVVGLLIESGDHNFAFDPVWAHLPAIPGETQRVGVNENSPINLFLMLSPNGQVTDEGVQPLSGYYHYDGSLTTPPCSEGVKWIVLTTPIQMSAAQIATFKAIIHDNNRPVQPLNGRELLVDVEANQ